jgi:hypothetical protein
MPPMGVARKSVAGDSNITCQTFLIAEPRKPAYMISISSKGFCWEDDYRCLKKEEARISRVDEMKIFCKANQKSVRPGKTEIPGSYFMIGAYHLLPALKLVY